MAGLPALRRLFVAIVAVVGAFLAMLLGLGVVTPTAALTSSTTDVCTYDSHHHPAVLPYTTPEREPPAAYNRGITDSAVDCWTQGTSLRTDDATTPAGPRMVHAVAG